MPLREHQRASAIVRDGSRHFSGSGGPNYNELPAPLQLLQPKWSQEAEALPA